MFSNFFSKAAFQAVSNGVFQGAVSGVQGGNFWSSFAAGAISSVAFSAFAGGKSLNVDGTTTNWVGLNGLAGGTSFGLIAYGTIAGGVASKLSGGNFWQGAATGLLVSSVSYLSNKIHDKATIRKMLIEKGYDPTGIPAMNNQQLYDLAKDVFPEMFKQTRQGNKKGFLLKYDKSISGKHDGETHSQNGKSVQQVLFGDGAFKSFAKLASVMGHEFNHVQNHFNGNYNIWASTSEIFATSKMELSARSWQLDHWGVTSSSTYIGLQLSDLKTYKY